MHVLIEIPDIIEYQDRFLKYWGKIFFCFLSENDQIRNLATSYVRLVEAALVEYRFGASRVRQFWDGQHSINLSAMIGTIAHFEICLSDMHRAVNFYKQLSSNKSKHPLSLALNAQKPNFARDFVATQLRDLRDAIHHSDKDIMRAKIKRGQSIALRADGLEAPHPTEASQTIKTIDRLVIGEHKCKRLAPSPEFVAPARS